MSKEYYESIMRSDIDYIKLLSIENGAILMNKPSVGSFSGFDLPVVDGIDPSEYSKWPYAKLMPYFSSFAVMGVINACEALGTDDGREFSLNFINWYIDHMNTAGEDRFGVAGTVYDYYIFRNNTDGRIVEVTLMDAHASQYDDPKDNPYDYDSTDSYAALFLEILYEYTRVFDESFLNDKKELVASLVNVILATYVESIDLTYAKPGYEICYLMDNCEVYKGFLTANKIYSEYIDDEAAAENALIYAEKIKAAILKYMWSEPDNAFTAGVGITGEKAYNTDTESLKRFYPEATSQLFPIIFGLLEPDDSISIKVYERFNNEYAQSGISGKDWTKLDKGDAYPWALVLKAAEKMSDYERASTFINSVKTRYINTNYTNHVYYNAESGHVLTVVSELYKIAKNEPDNDNSNNQESGSGDTSNGSTSSNINISGKQSGQPSSEKDSKLFMYIAAACAGIGVIAGCIALFNRKSKKKH